jgi:hypothetical protein
MTAEHRNLAHFSSEALEKMVIATLAWALHSLKASCAEQASIS